MELYIHCWELMNSEGSPGSQSLLLMMRVMVRHFVSDPHKVMAGFIVLVVGTMNILLWRFFCNLKDMFSNGFSIF